MLGPKIVAAGKSTPPLPFGDSATEKATVSNIGFEQQALIEFWEKFYNDLFKTIKTDVTPAIARQNKKDTSATAIELEVKNADTKIVFRKNTAELVKTDSAEADVQKIFNFVLAAKKANPAFVTEGIAIDLSHGTDKENALVVLTAQKLGLHIANEAECFKAIGKVINDSRAEFNAFTKEQVSYQAAKTASPDLEDATVGKKRGVLKEPTGFALKALGFMNRDDFDKVGKIQGELLAIRDACKNPDGTYNSDKLAALPQFNGNPDLGGLVADEAKRQGILNSLSVSKESIDKAVAYTNTGKGIEQDKTLFVPLAAMIQEKSGIITPATKSAMIAAQQYERLMSDLGAFKSRGVTANDHEPKNDLKVFPNDAPVSKTIQAGRQALDELVKSTQLGQKISTNPLNAILKSLDLPSIESGVTDLIETAKTSQSEPQKSAALDKAVLYFKDSVTHHHAVLGVKDKAVSGPSGFGSGPT